MKTVYHIGGMHCKSCELLIEKSIGKIKGVNKVDATFSTGVLEIESELPIFPDAITAAIGDFGYKILKNHEEVKEHRKEIKEKNSFFDYVEILASFAVVSLMAFILVQMDISKIFPNIGENTGVLIALLVGLIASISTCLALIGGIVIGFGSTYPVEENAKNPLLSRSKPHIYFHIGRIVGFFILGGILGLIGSKINYSITFTGYLTIIVAVVMFYLGLQILNLVPNITSLGFHLPKFLSRKIHNLEGNNHFIMPMIIGVLTFFLPCGFTQSMQISAMASGSFLAGGLIMGAFALGTVPVLISLGVGSTFAQKSNFGLAHKLVGAVVIIFALYSLNSGLTLSGSNLSLKFWGANNQAYSEVKDNIQVVKMDLDYGFSPSEFRIKKDIPVRFEINGINISGCANQIVIPKLGITKDISPGINVIEFTPEEEGVLPFSCWMGMLTGKFIVET